MKAKNKKSKVRTGLTLAEALVAMTILTIVASGVILPYSAGAAVQAEAARRTAVVKLTADLLEEIINSDFSTINDWDGYSESQGQIAGADGGFFTDPVYTGLTRSVSLQTATVGGVDLVWVTVSVQYNGNEVVQLSRLIGE